MPARRDAFGGSRKRRVNRLALARSQHRHSDRAIGDARVNDSAAQHRGHAHAGSAWHANRRYGFERFVGTTEVRGILGKQRHIADPSAFVDCDQGLDGRCATITNAQRHRRAYGTERQLRDAVLGAHGQGGITPRFTRGALRHRDRVAPFRAHMHNKRHAARHAGRQLVEAKRRQQRSLKRADRMQYRRETIRKHSAGGQQTDDTEQRNTTAPELGRSQARSELRRQCLRRQPTRHVLRGAHPECTLLTDFKGAAQRSGPKRLLLFDRSGQQRY